MKLTKRSRDSLKAYVLDLLGRMLLDWRVEVKRSFCSNDYHAPVTTGPEYRTACLQVSPEVCEKSPDELRHWITHELSHLYSARFSDTVVKMCPGRHGYAVGKAVESLDDELAEHLARAFEKHMPLPKFKLEAE